MVAISTRWQAFSLWPTQTKVFFFYIFSKTSGCPIQRVKRYHREEDITWLQLMTLVARDARFWQDFFKFCSSLEVSMVVIWDSKMWLATGNPNNLDAFASVTQVQPRASILAGNKGSNRKDNVFDQITCTRSSPKLIKDLHNPIDVRHVSLNYQWYVINQKTVKAFLLNWFYVYTSNTSKI
jgi:hypothetical protein